jgi:hypothetical protein
MRPYWPLWNPLNLRKDVNVYYFEISPGLFHLLAFKPKMKNVERNSRAKPSF